ncbi:unnamed protein product [Lampetra planeri]
MQSDESDDEFDATEMKRLVSDHDADAGALSEPQKRRRSRRGPDEAPCAACTWTRALGLCAGLLVLCVAAASLAYLSGDSGHTVVDVKLPDGAALRGLHSTFAYAFLGIPYAAAPARRWEPPRSVRGALWNGTYVATAYGSPCAQRGPAGEVLGQEDCLYLNVWTPTLGGAARRPVIVWLHGGHLTRGSGHEEGLAPGEELAAQTNAVFVSLNYRLGALGFLALKELSDENLEHTSGNYGLMDQLKALRWVQKNIEVFGGDIGNVTLLGYEAGAVCALALATSPAARGLFSRVVAMSASCRMLQPNLREAEERGRSVYNGTSCGDGDLACLRGAELGSLLAASPFEDYAAWEDSRLASDFPAPQSEEPPFFPAVVDGCLVPTPLAQGISRVNVSLVLGSTQQEVAIRPPYPEMDRWTTENFSSTLMERIENLAPGRLSQLLQLYPPDCPPPCPGKRYCTAVTDLKVTCPLDDLANATRSRQWVAGSPSPRVYRYEAAFVPEWGAEASQRPLFAARGTDARAFLGSLSAGGPKIHDREWGFTRLVRYYLMRFISTGSMPEQWPEWPGAALLSDEFTPRHVSVNECCEFWRQSSEQGPARDGARLAGGKRPLGAPGTPSATLALLPEARCADIAGFPLHEPQQHYEDAYESFMRQHLKHYGYYHGRPSAGPRPPGPPPWRSTQLVLEEGAGAPRLREPLQGPAPSASALPAHAPRWPLDCQVVPERVAHIDWDPSEPEPLYEATGREHEPLCVGDESGEVVFEIEKASSERCFVSARIGGRRGPLVPPPAATRGDDDSTLLFESRFESGNLQKAVRVGEWEYELTLRSDLYTDKHTQWFYFRVGNTRAAPRRYRFTITNLGKPRSLYGAGLRPLFYSDRDAAGPLALGWRRAGSDVRYYRTRTAAAAAAETRARYSLTWTFSFPHEGDECYWAHCYPYTYSRLAARLARVAADPRAARLCRTRVLCRSLAGNPVPVLTITGGARAALLGRAKRAVVVTARVHPGESNSSWVMEGLLDFLLGDSADARLLRDTFVFKVVPMLNPDGVLVGNYRCSLSGRDLNRNYRTALREAFPPVWHLRAMVRRLLEKREVVMFCDLHGHSRRSNVFVYGCEGAAGSGHGPRGGQSGRVFPLMMSKNSPDKFSYESCRFKVQKSKEGTSRVSMWRMGIANSFTLETTFAGSTLGERKGTHFSVEDLKSVGYQLCDTLLDYCDPDQAKVELCEREVMERAQATERMRNLGKDGGGPWGLGLSDIESSESGSDSSQSDGLPSHLLALLPKMRVKRRRLKSRKERNRTRLGLLQAVGAVGALGSGFPPNAGPRRAGPRRGPARPSGGALAEAAAEAAGEPVRRKEADKVHTQRYRRSGPATTVMAAVGGARGGPVAATVTQGPPGAQTSVPLAYVGSNPLAGVSTLTRDAAASAQTQAATPTLDPGHGDFCPAHGTLATQYLSGLLEEGWGLQWEGSGLSLRHVTRHMAPSSRRRMLLGGQLVLPVSMTTALPPTPRRPPRTAIRQHPLPFDPWLEEAGGFLSSGRLQRSSREPLSLLPATQRPASVRMGPLSRTPRPLGAIGSGDAGTPERGAEAAAAAEGAGAGESVRREAEPHGDEGARPGGPRHRHRGPGPLRRGRAACPARGNGGARGRRGGAVVVRRRLVARRILIAIASLAHARNLRPSLETLIRGGPAECPR